MTKESIADNTVKNNYLRDMKKWVSAQDMDKAVEVIVKLCEIWGQN